MPTGAPASHLAGSHTLARTLRTPPQPLAPHTAPNPLPQAKTADGSEARYIGNSSSYLRYYAAALRSARERAPSLLPVLVVLNDMPPDFLAWVEAQVGMWGRSGA